MRIEVLLEKKPKKQLRLYELSEEDIMINLPKVSQW